MSYVTHADLGGRTGFGRVVPEDENEGFHEAWEPLALAITVAMGATGSWTIDQSRAARETLPDYLQLGYYQIWIGALEKLMLERGLVTEQEIAQAQVLQPAKPLARVLRAADTPAALARGSATDRPDARVQVAFNVGDRVRTRSHEVPHHTRLPGYARGKVGTIERVHGPHVFADTSGQGLGEHPQPLYTVVFDGRELWGDDAAPGLRVSIDAWQPYLEAA
ncbi:nitrile hydratase subunit beta [Ramlibacter algicola]|uniref:Nitrile hydratase subunit beta n=1 Tax=Ramlibacter algicola TaxID=2795217 RepID=A0A934Q5G2_9BURK|nr:nitrile hydratase subunit beta [Ramlibacter algicola]MBK0394817.1 nitrile hydratase subunit beta [Ramlibacter algicola]